jgi:hypothetical protein
MADRHLCTLSHPCTQTAHTHTVKICHTVTLAHMTSKPLCANPPHCQTVPQQAPAPVPQCKGGPQQQTRYLVSLDSCSSCRSHYRQLRQPPVTTTPAADSIGRAQYWLRGQGPLQGSKECGTGCVHAGTPDQLQDWTIITPPPRTHTSRARHRSSGAHRACLHWSPVQVFAQNAR